MRDDWYGHRDPFTWEKTGDKDEWLDWDFALVDALQTMEDYTDAESGLLVWEMEDDNAYVNANRKINKFAAARDKKTQAKNYKAVPGENFVPEIKSHKKDADGNPVFQTMREWMQKEIEKGN